MATEFEESASPTRKFRFGGPRGFLRVYILYRLSKQSMSGYDLISELGAVTGWRPGSGSIYPILESLKGASLIEVVSKGKRSKQVYSLTRKGRKELADDRKAINHMIYEFATKYNKIRVALAGMVSAENLSTLVIELFKSNRVVWQQILTSKELGNDELEFKLKEYGLLLDNEMRWVKDQLKAHPHPGT